MYYIIHYFSSWACLKCNKYRVTVRGPQSCTSSNHKLMQLCKIKRNGFHQNVYMFIEFLKIIVFYVPVKYILFKVAQSYTVIPKIATLISVVV